MIWFRWLSDCVAHARTACAARTGRPSLHSIVVCDFPTVDQTIGRDTNLKPLEQPKELIEVHVQANPAHLQRIARIHRSFDVLVPRSIGNECNDIDGFVLRPLMYSPEMPTSVSPG